MTNEQQLFTADPDLYLAQRQKMTLALYRLWSSLIPDHQPTEQNFAGWLDTFGAEAAAIAIRRTAQKARTRMREHDPMRLTDLERYATGTMKHLGKASGTAR
jgi:hypothetical protein